MTRTLHVDVDLTVEDDADDMDVADAIIGALHTAAEFGVVATDDDGIVSFDGTEPMQTR